MVRLVAVDDDRERLDRVAGDQDLHLDEVGGLVAQTVVVVGGVALGAALEGVEEVRDDLAKRHVVGELDPLRGEVLHADGGPALLVAEAHDGAHVFFGADDGGADHGLPDLVEVLRQVARVGDLDGLAVRLDLVLHARGGGYEVQPELPLQPLLHDLHVQEPQEPAAEPEAHPRVLRLVEERGVVELQLGERVPEALELVPLGRVEAAEDGRQDLGVAGKGLGGGVLRTRHRVADAEGLDVLEAGYHVAYLARPERRQGGGFRRVAAHLEQLELLLRAHRLDSVSLAQLAVEEAGQRDDAAVRIVVGVEDKGPRLLAARRRRGDPVHDGVQDIYDALAGLGRDLEYLVLFHPEELDELCGGGRHVCYWQVYLVQDRDDLQVLLHREIEVRQRLGLDALACVHDEEGAFASRDGPRDLVGEVHVARGVDEVEHPVAIVPLVEEPDGLGLDGYAALALELHGVQDLVHPFPLGDRLGDVQQPVGEGALAVVDVRDYAEIAGTLDVFHRPSLP